MNKKFIFNWLPPAHCNWPSPSGSILKSFLSQHGISTDVNYWNIMFENFQNDFWDNGKRTIGENPLVNLLPFINYIAIHSKDVNSFNKVKYELLRDHPQWLNMEARFIDNRMLEYANRLDKIIDEKISEIQIEKCFLFGVSSKISQWIPANIICTKVKNLYPELPIVIGGFGTKEEAFAIMRNFDFYDYAIWGEGEYPLLELCHAIDVKSNINSIPYLIYRNTKNEPILSIVKKKLFLDLNNGIIPDFDDYIEQHDNNKDQMELSIESSRGCHWRQCKFCYLNDGYKYRMKDVENKIKEIKYQIEKYGITKFIFLDNDIIGRNLDAFNVFLDRLIELRVEYQSFKVTLAEVITKGIDYNIVKKMTLAGFTHVQIGYESPSNELLKKINKKNSFASNLLFIKWASHFSIHIGGLNVLSGLLEETDDNVIESINNLYFMRFFLKKGYFEHNMSFLSIMKSSRYFDEIGEDKLSQWDNGNFYNILPDSYIDKKDRFNVFQFSNLKRNHYWQYFEEIEEHFKKGLYEYKLIQHAGNVCYRELCNKELINELEFDSPLHWHILTLANHKVISLQHIQENLTIDIPEICVAIDSLKEEGLLYCTEDYSEMVTIINTDLLIC